jgi:metal-responsive CopG/Arc/MetJ family transcriptional regulator
MLGRKGSGNMIDLGEFKTRSISGLPDELVERFDMVAKRVVGTRSGMIRLLMTAVVENARCSWEREGRISQFVAHSINDTFKMVGIEVPIDRKT